MREILFRGKRKDNGEWVYGSGINQGADIIDYEKWAFVYDDIIRHEVIPETVGEYTGLCDKNGTKVFEGDIVRFSTAHAREIKYIDGCFGFEGSSIPIKYVNKFEVIGNVTDNPEFLGQGE